MMLFTRMLSLRPGTPGLRAAYAANDQVDLDAGIARDIKRIDEAGIDQRVELGPDLGRTPRLGMGDLLVNMVEQPLLERQGEIEIRSSSSGCA